MSTDRELLELAAKAAGLTGEWSKTIGGWDCLILDYQLNPWQPLQDDGDALRLAVKLRISLDVWTGHISAVTPKPGTKCREVFVYSEESSAARRAIVRAAAAIGKAMP